MRTSRVAGVILALLCVAVPGAGAQRAAGSADLVLFTWVRPVAGLGGTLNLRFEIFNTFGPDTAQGVTFTDTLPSGVKFVSATARQVQPQDQPQGTCTGTTTITCSLGSVPRLSSIQITIAVTPTTLGSLTDTGTLTSDTSDPKRSDDRATATTTAVPAHTA